MRQAFLYRKKMVSVYSFFDRGLMVPLSVYPIYWVTIIMSQRSLFNFIPVPFIVSQFEPEKNLDLKEGSNIIKN